MNPLLQSYGNRFIPEISNMIFYYAPLFLMW